MLELHIELDCHTDLVEHCLQRGGVVGNTIASCTKVFHISEDLIATRVRIEGGDTLYKSSVKSR